MLHRVYIDEAGDRGRSAGSSDHFVVAAAVVSDENDAAVREELRAAKASIDLPTENVVHFRKLSHSKKVRICRDISDSSVATIVNVIVCKKRLRPSPGEGLAYLSNPDPLYLWATRLLLERVSWFIRDQGGGSSIVTFAHLTRFKSEKLHNYREALEHSDTTIEWASFRGHPFRINDPASVRLLQIADCAASAVYKAVEEDALNVTEPRYLEEMKAKLYRGRGPITSCGLKVFPPDVAASGQPLHFLRRF